MEEDEDVEKETKTAKKDTGATVTLEKKKKRDKYLFVRKTFVDDFMMVTTFSEYNLMAILSTLAKYMVYFGSISALVYSVLYPLFLKTESRKYLKEKHDDHPTEE